MAQQNITIGKENSGGGDSLFAAFTKVQNNFTELYTDDAGDVGSITATAPISRDSATGAVTISLLDNGVTHAKLEPRYTGTATITATSGATSIDWATATVFIMQNACTGAKEFDFTNYKLGQVITIHNLRGDYTITLDSDAATSETFNKLGEKNYDGTATGNALMVECISDSANAIFNYSVLDITSDPTPN
tara:strand:+ start:1011 stop:1583 length:573 start_codon:yes stop_codon:yes gene_type:complete